MDNSLVITPFSIPRIKTLASQNRSGGALNTDQNCHSSNNSFKVMRWYFWTLFGTTCNNDAQGTLMLIIGTKNVNGVFFF